MSEDPTVATPPPRALAKLIVWVESPGVGMAFAVGSVLAAAMFAALELLAPEPPRRPALLAYPAGSLWIGGGALVVAAVLAAGLRLLGPRESEGGGDDDHA